MTRVYMMNSNFEPLISVNSKTAEIFFSAHGFKGFKQYSNEKLYVLVKSQFDFYYE
jgi:hypothetical protein